MINHDKVRREQLKTATLINIIGFAMIMLTIGAIMI